MNGNHQVPVVEKSVLEHYRIPLQLLGLGKNELIIRTTHNYDSINMVTSVMGKYSCYETSRNAGQNRKKN